MKTLTEIPPGWAECGFCFGHGRDSFSNEVCFFCRGKGIAKIHNPQPTTTKSNAR